jgi:hypothetical protein
MVWAGFIRLRIGAIGRVLYTFGYHKMRSISPLPEGLVAGTLLIFCRTFLVLKLTFTLVLTLYGLFGWYVTAVPNQFGAKCPKVLQTGKHFKIFYGRLLGTDLLTTSPAGITHIQTFAGCGLNHFILFSKFAVIFWHVIITL